MKSLVRIKPIPQTHLTEHVQTLTELAHMQRQHHADVVQICNANTTSTWSRKYCALERYSL